MLLRGIRAHLLTSLATLALAFVVAAGAVGVVGASRVGGTPGAVAAMLVLYGAVALAEQTARATGDRSHDVALARLRGLTGLRLVGFAAGPLLTVSLIGVVAGSVTGTWLAGRIADGWGTAYSLGTRDVVVAVSLLLGSWLTVAVVAAAVIRRPLITALSVSPRRHAASWVRTFLELLVVAAAVLAVYEAHRGGHSWVPVVAPALVALAAGQLVMWLLALTPRVGRRLGPALTSRRLRRDPDPGSVVRVLVAAAVLLAVTLTGGAAAADWRDDAGRLKAGGPVVVPFASGALRAYAAAHAADPHGRWLMPAVVVDDLQQGQRRTYVDAARWDAVVGDFMATTALASSAPQIAHLASGRSDLVVFSGDTVTVRASDLSGGTATLRMSYLADAGYLRSVRIDVTHDGESTAGLADCRVGCSLLAVSVSGAGSFTLDALAVGPVAVIPAPHHVGGVVTTHVVDLRDGAAGRLPGLSTPGLGTSRNVDGLDGVSTPVDVTGTVPAVPFLGRTGTMLDLPSALTGAVGTVAAARSVVVARADTPAALLARLHRAGGGAPTSYAAEAARLSHTPQARADDLALWVAVGVALVALTHLLAWLAGQVGRRRAEVAGLRTAGIGPGSVRRAYLVEATWLAVIVLVTATVTAAATTHTLLTPMELVGGWADAPAVDLTLRPVMLLLVVVGTAVVTAVACAVVFTRFGRNARPSALRAADR
ncbi:MAG TPA: hypothetical protein VFJ89_06185 [Nocardioides sp.]|nr:hypothetical protein [Nocardioides sp.]